MGRSFTRILLINFALAAGTYGGIKMADFIFWNDDIKYEIWEQTEKDFWVKNGMPKYIKPKVKFESILVPNTIFTSYIKESGPDDIDQVLEKYT